MIEIEFHFPNYSVKKVKCIKFRVSKKDTKYANWSKKLNTTILMNYEDFHVAKHMIEYIIQYSILETSVKSFKKMILTMNTHELEIFNFITLQAGFICPVPIFNIKVLCSE